MTTTEDQFRLALHEAIDAYAEHTHAAVDAAALVESGTRAVHRRRLAVLCGSSITVGLIAALGIILLGSERGSEAVRPAGTTSTVASWTSPPESASAEVQNPAGPDLPDLGLRVRASRSEPGDDARVLVWLDDTPKGSATFSRRAIDAGQASHWLDEQTLVVAMPLDSQPQVLTDAFDNQSSATVSLPSSRLQVTVTVFRQTMGPDSSAVGVVWRDADRRWHATANTGATHLRVGSGHDAVDFWVSTRFNTAGQFSWSSWSASPWSMDGYQSAMRHDDEATGKSVFVVETEQSRNLTFAPDSARPDVTVTPTSTTPAGSRWWAVFEVETRSVGTTSMVMWPRPDGQIHRGVVR